MILSRSKSEGAFAFATVWHTGRANALPCDQGLAVAWATEEFRMCRTPRSIRFPNGRGAVRPHATRAIGAVDAGARRAGADSCWRFGNARRTARSDATGAINAVCAGYRA